MLDLCALAQETTKILQPLERSVQSWRRHFQPTEINTLHSEQARQMIAYASAVIHIDPTRAIDEDADQAAASRLLETYQSRNRGRSAYFQATFPDL